MSVFTVKATYRSETRKFIFTSTVFPTYDKLYSQVSSPSLVTCIEHLPQPFPSCTGCSRYPIRFTYPNFSSPPTPRLMRGF